MSFPLWMAAIACAAIGILAPAVLRPHLKRFGAVDVPSDRSSHSRPILRGGGIGPMAGMVVGVLLALTSITQPSQQRMLVIVLASGIAVGLLGLIEDVRGLKIGVRAFVQLVIGASAAALIGLEIDSPWWITAFGAVLLAAYVNVANFMDGINGISSLHGLVAGFAFSVIGIASDEPWLLAVGLLTAVAFTSFLPWNFSKSGMFLGDVGSYFLGGILGATALAAAYSGVAVIAAIGPLCIYLADTFSVIVRRARRGEAISRPHRNHSYQRLTDTGLSHLTVAVIVAGASLATSGLGIMVHYGILSWTSGTLAIAALCAGYLSLPRLRGHVLSAPANGALLQRSLPAPNPARSEYTPIRWVVVGATGFVGKAVVAELQEHGADVTGISAPRLELDPTVSSGSEIMTAAVRLADTEAIARDLHGADVVINAAGLATPDAQADARLYGANALLPTVLAYAARAAGVIRFIHLSSAAVQGRRMVLDAGPEVAPFSQYSRSKALGEHGLLSASEVLGNDLDIVIVRATSVQGPGRMTTASLRRIARSQAASVAAPGDQPTVVSSAGGLASFVRYVGHTRKSLPTIVLQPWEGLSVSEVLTVAGGRRPRNLPRWFCKSLVSLGTAVGRVVPEVAGSVRRVELMWFGQQQALAVEEHLRTDADSFRLRQALGATDEAD